MTNTQPNISVFISADMEGISGIMMPEMLYSDSPFIVARQISVRVIGQYRRHV
ncbi:MAG: hypothetical protein U0641_18030 [Anaerolineae bacterium]